MLNYHNDLPDADESEHKSLTEQALREVYSLRALAKEYKVSLDSETEEYISGLVKNGGYESEEEYTEALAQWNMTKYVMKLLLENESLRSALYYSLTDEFTGIIRSDDKTVEADIAENFVCATQILILNDEGDDVEKNRALAEDIKARLDKGESFLSLAKKYSEDTSLTDPAAGYYLTKGQFIESFENAAFALEIGETSDIVESSLGFHIIKRLSHDPEYINRNFDELREAFLARKFNEFTAARAEAAEVKYTELYEQLTLDSLK